MISEDRLVDGVFIFCTSCTNILLARPWNAVRRVWTAPEAKGALDTFVKETLFHFAGPLNAFFSFTDNNYHSIHRFRQKARKLIVEKARAASSQARVPLPDMQ